MSLCGGKALVDLSEKLKGLPLGVYVTDQIIKKLKKKQIERKIRIKGENLFFIKHENPRELIGSLPSTLIHRLNSGQKLSRKLIKEECLNKLGFSPEYIRKFEPFFSAHFNLIKQIEREKSCCKKKAIIKSPFDKWVGALPSKKGKKTDEIINEIRSK